MNTKNKQKDIEELRKRIYDFVVRIVNLVKELPNNLIGNRIGGQLLDAGTSVGANFEEACAAFSKADFTYKISISKKEAEEVEIKTNGLSSLRENQKWERRACPLSWLRLLHRRSPRNLRLNSVI